MRVETDGPLCWLTLDRPEKGNALNPDVLSEIDGVLDEQAGDTTTKVLILQGAGRGFCSGHELGRDRGSDDVVSVTDRLRRPFGTFRRLWDFPKPVIASVHGYCFGAATQLCTACDLVIVTSDARIGLPRLPMGAGLTPPMLALAVGLRRAKELAFDIGSAMDGSTAAAWGWANHCVPPDTLHVEVQALGRRIARAPAAVLAGQKASLNRVAEQQGFWAAALSGIEMDALHHYAHTGRPTSEAIRRHGVTGALALFDQGELGEPAAATEGAADTGR